MVTHLYGILGVILDRTFGNIIRMLRVIRLPKEERGHLSWTFVGTLAVILAYGLIMMFSASYSSGYTNHGGNIYYFIKPQAIVAAVGFVVMLGVSLINYRALRYMFWTFYVITLALLVLDGSQELSEEDEQAITAAQSVPNLLVLVNKGDLPRRLDIGRLADRFDNVLTISARTGEGLDTLSDAVAALYPAGETPAGELLTNARQADAVSRALSAVAEARSALRIGMTPDVVLTDCEAALEALGELNGKRIREDLVDTIFSRFCVGK